MSEQPLLEGSSAESVTPPAPATSETPATLGATGSKNAKIRYEGQEVSLPETIAADDTTLRAALCTVWPSITTAEISRTREDGTLIVSCAKKAGSKGGCAEVAAQLAAAPERRNSAVPLAEELLELTRLQQLSPQMLAGHWKKIVTAIKRGSDYREAVNKVVNKLKELPAQPATSVPDGF